MITVYRFDKVPITIALDSIKNIYVENNLLYINLKNGNRICGYNIHF